MRPYSAGIRPVPVGDDVSNRVQSVVEAVYWVAWEMFVGITDLIFK